MIAGVGSHINHPGKAKYKTPIIKGYPIEAYHDKMIVWEEEFLPRYEKFLLKNNLTHDVTNPNIDNFIKSEWKRIKALANSQNKVLLVNDDYIYSKFFTDFS